MTELQCGCGGVKIRIEGEPLFQLYCHCDDCRAATGAAYIAAAVFPAAKVEIVAGSVKSMVVKQTPRIRCEACGYPLYSELGPVKMRSVNAFLLPQGVFKPQFHVQCRHAVLPVADNLPHYSAFPGAFGGAETFVDW